MAIEEQRLRIRQSLEESLGVEEALYLMDRPPGGWSDLVTNHTLDLKFEVFNERFEVMKAQIEASVDQLRAELNTDIARLESRLAWKMMTAVIAGMAVMGGVFAGLVSITGG